MAASPLSCRCLGGTIARALASYPGIRTRLSSPPRVPRWRDGRLTFAGGPLRYRRLARPRPRQLPGRCVPRATAGVAVDPGAAPTAAVNGTSAPNTATRTQLGVSDPGRASAHCVGGQMTRAPAAAAHLAQDLVVPPLPQRRRAGGLTPSTGGIVRGLGLFQEHQGGEHLADVIGVPGVAAGELLDRGALALPERFHELVRDLPQRVRGGKAVVVHPQDPPIPSMPPGMPWNTSLSRFRART
jgi:hypothetical protein